MLAMILTARKLSSLPLSNDIETATKLVHEMANVPPIDAPRRGPGLAGRRRRSAGRPRPRGGRRGRPALPRSRHGRGRSASTPRSSIRPSTCAPSTSPISPPPSARASTASRRREDGSLLREYEIFAVDREIEIAPGLVFPAWTFNGQVPGPTLRATEGDRVRVRFTNQGTHPHTLHFHGWHPPAMDGSLPEHQVPPGGEFLYEFDAEPYGLHLYHCHAIPLKRHIHKGLYGVFLVDPKAARPPADEMVMVMNAFDTNFDADNEVYAVNTVGFHHMVEPIQVKVGELVRINLVNVTEFDLINSLHLHGMFFDVYRTGTRLEPSETTDTRDAVPGRARDPRDALPLPRTLHVPRPSERVRRARLDGLLRRGGSMSETSAGSARVWILALLPLLLIAGLVWLVVRHRPGGEAARRAAADRGARLRAGRARRRRHHGHGAQRRARSGHHRAGPGRRGVLDVHAGAGRDRWSTSTRVRLAIPYPWVANETHEVKVLTSNGIPFAHEIAVATETPRPSWRFFAWFALIGLYVGVIPIAVGLLWYPAIGRMGRRGLDFVLALTIGLLDLPLRRHRRRRARGGGRSRRVVPGRGAVHAGRAARLPRHRGVRGVVEAPRAGADRGPWVTALLIAVGIGLHNFGEGLAIGAAYSLGEVTLGALLIVGFTLHNTTEGLAIVAPLVESRASIGQFVLLGVVAGAPTIAGAWLGRPGLFAAVVGRLPRHRRRRHRPGGDPDRPPDGETAPARDPGGEPPGHGRAAGRLRRHVRHRAAGLRLPRLFPLRLSRFREYENRLFGL